MKRYVENLRQQPKEVRSHAALVGAGVVTGCLALVWVTTLPGRFSIDVNDPYIDRIQAQNEVVEEPSGGFLSGVFDSFQNNVANPLTATEESAVEPVVEESELLDLDAIMRAGATAPEPGDVVTREDNIIIIATSSADALTGS